MILCNETEPQSKPVRREADTDIGVIIELKLELVGRVWIALGGPRRLTKQISSRGYLEERDARHDEL